MPISYEPAGPYSASTSYAYGALAQANQDRDYAMRQQSMDQQRELAMAGIRQQSLAQQQQAMNENARIQHQEYMASNAQAEQRMQREAMQRPSERDQWAAGQQQEMAQQHYGAQRQLQQEQMTQAESMRLQQLNAADAELEKLHTIDGTLDREGYLEGKARIRGLQGPLSAKMQRVQIQEKAAKTRMEMEQAARTATIDNLNVKFASSSAEDRVRPINNKDGSLAGHMVQTGPGKWEFHASKTAELNQAAQDKVEKTERDRFEHAYKEEEKTVDSIIQHTPETERAAKAASRTEDIQKRMADRGFGATPDKNLQNLHDKQTGRTVEGVIMGRFAPRTDTEVLVADVGKMARFKQRAGEIAPGDFGVVHRLATEYAKGLPDKMDDDQFEKYFKAVKNRRDLLPDDFYDRIHAMLVKRVSDKGKPKPEAPLTHTGQSPYGRIM